MPARHTLVSVQANILQDRPLTGLLLEKPMVLNLWFSLFRLDGHKDVKITAWGSWFKNRLCQRPRTDVAFYPSLPFTLKSGPSEESLQQVVQKRIRGPRVAPPKRGRLVVEPKSGAML